jgi:Spy/CpxP family protein refolding chaperone
MNRFLLAGILLAASNAFAQSAALSIAKPSCEKPQMPGEMMRQDEKVTKRYNQEVDAWQKCMKSYIDERQAVMRANEEAANAAIKEYNDTIKALNAAATGDSTPGKADSSSTSRSSSKGY